MFRKACIRPVLLSALVCVLSWVAICNAAPMDASSPTTSTEAALGIPFDNTEETAYIQNLPHYNGLPMIDLRTQSQDIIDLARMHNGAAYIYHNPVYKDERFSPYIYRYGQRATRAPYGEIAQLQSKLNAARTDGRQFGNAVRWLKHGRPFRQTYTRPYSWKEVWDGSQVLATPSSQDSVDWFAIRNILQGQRRVVLQDPARHKTVAFRLDAFGQVECDVKDLVRALHRRSYASSIDVPPGHILETNADGAKKLLKRGQHFKPAPSTAPILGRMDLVLAFQEGLDTRDNLPRTRGEAEVLDRKYAQILHFEGRPVFNANQFSVAQLEQAAVDYDYIYVYGILRGERQVTVAQVFRDRAPIHPARNSELLRSAMAEWERDGDLYGPEIRELLHGRPIRRNPSGLHPSKTIYTGPGHAPLTLLRLRTALETAESLRIHERNGNILKFVLDQHGVPQIANYLGSAHFKRSLDKQMSQFGSSNIDPNLKLFHEAAPASHQLVKRMDVERPRNLVTRAWEPRHVEYYSQFGFVEPSPPLPALTVEERSKLFANLLHYEGEPIFFPADDRSTPERASQAIADHEGFWVVGNHVHDPNNPVALRIRRGGRIGSHGDQKVLQHIINANAFEITYGRAGKFLKFGPGFPPRKSTVFRRYKVPSWRKVEREAERVPHTTPMSEIWEKLHQKNMLVVTEGTKVAGFALDGGSNVLSHLL